MSNNSIRIKTTPIDKYFKVQINQDFDFIEVLSLKISQEEVYRNFCADYGVVTGRVIVNDGFGVPNAKVSIFIPIDDIDKSNPEIYGLYPYELVTDKDENGIRYNLLSKTPQSENDCFTPVGTFPEKREILDNPELLNIYTKYYKFTTTTNYAGDYMLFGVPLGTYVVHVDVDISDIGIISQRPYDSISQGMPKTYFESGTKFKGGTNLDRLIQIKTANSSVNVQPFWGNSDNCEIGINRVDLDLNYNVIPSAIFMGNIFGDNDKNSVNKNCTPRKDLGNLCDQITTEGTIEMIRETIDGTIEEFSVEGGRLIDGNGTWAYQIPMNLDYMVTDEFGNMTLSNDPNKGIPTRANVRFRIGMDQTGGEGRLRTRAKYLVPNNPDNTNEIDYEFSEKTLPSSFRTLYWNKIYTISNFIPRFQQKKLLTGGVHTKHTTSIKNVEDCSDKTPFPFNRVDTKLNPLFFIICMIIKIIATIVYVVNAVLVVLINTVLNAINFLFNIICTIINAIIRPLKKVLRFLRIKSNIDTIKCSGIPYVPCIFVKCPFDDGPMYAPGCVKSGDIRGNGWYALKDQTGPPLYYPGDDFGHKDSPFDLAGLDDCVAATMANAMNLFRYNFENDWINGTLFSFLLKYKKKRKGKEKFCELDCNDIESGGVDGNTDGKADNKCVSSYLVDTNYTNQTDSHSTSLSEGLIKKYNGEFYYAATTKNASTKLFATEIINLGSVFSCDWQGVPKIQPHLIETTYNMPPLTQEVDEDQSTILTTGQFDIGGTTLGLFFGITCLGPNMNQRQCLNVRHICEFGVELDEYRDGVKADGIIGISDLDVDDSSTPKVLRDTLAGLNTVRNTSYTTLPKSTNFNTGDLATYNFASKTNNGNDYIDFRGYPLDINGSYTQPKHSYFFYFGLKPGQTALNKMNQNFFSYCPQPMDNGMIVKVKTTNTSLPLRDWDKINDGTATITIDGGTPPYSGSVSGPSNYKTKFVIGENNTEPTITLTGLAIGTYIITVTDDSGETITQQFNIIEKPELYATAYVNTFCTSSEVPNGSIAISSFGGGHSNSYSYTLLNSDNGIVSTGVLISAPTLIENLAKDTSHNAILDSTGYTLIITDGISDIMIKDLSVEGASVMVVNTIKKEDVLCFGEQTGLIELNIVGGSQPYSVKTTGPNDYYSQSYSMTNLSAGTYTTIAIDTFGTSATTTNIISNLGKEMIIEAADSSILSKQCDTTKYTITLNILSSVSANEKIYLQYNGLGNEDANGDLIFIPVPNSPFTYTPNNPIVFTLGKGLISDTLVVRMVDANGHCYSNEVEIYKEEIELPTMNLNISLVDNKKQCTPNQLIYKFNINTLSSGSENESYTAYYSYKTGIGSFSNFVAYKTKITKNQQEMIIPLNQFIPPNSTQIKVYIVDDKRGCVSNTISDSVVLPTVPLSATLTKVGGQYTVNGIKWQNYQLTASGGLPPYSCTQYTIYDPKKPTETTISAPVSQKITPLVSDSVGCTIVAT